MVWPSPGSWAEFPSPLALFPHSGILVPLMAEKLDPKEIVTLEELAALQHVGNNRAGV